jgi:transposase InsO family protein
MQLTQSYPVKTVCNVLAVPRSTFYYSSHQKDEEDLHREIEEIAAQWPTYGYRRVTHQLRRNDWRVNHKRVYRIMRENGLQAHQKRKTKRTTNSQHPFLRYPNLLKNQVVDKPDLAWVADITYIRLQHGFVYLAVLMDLFTRSIRGWHLGRDLSDELTQTALKKALLTGYPQIHHSDQGWQYASNEYVALLQEANVQISMADVGAAWQNGFAERLIRTIKEEEVYLTEYRNYWDAYNRIEYFLEDVYMHKRIHSSLGYLTPAEFEAQYSELQFVS